MASTVAAEGFEDVYVAALVTVAVIESVSVAVAIKCRLVPAARLFPEVEDSAREVTAAAVTVMFTVALFPSYETVIVTLPTKTAVTAPEALTVAIVGAEEV